MLTCYNREGGMGRYATFRKEAVKDGDAILIAY
jgi:hypothetical protein